jgi:hypothetical protein
MGKYDPLRQYLEGQNADVIEVTFSQLESILGFPLPRSAHDHQAWWANETHGSHSHARSWQEAGWETRGVNPSVGKVRFQRRKDARRRLGSASGGSRDLWKKARMITGIENRDELIERALLALIQREAAQALIRLGGSDPDAKAAPRERPWA